MHGIKLTLAKLGQLRYDSLRDVDSIIAILVRVYRVQLITLPKMFNYASFQQNWCKQYADTIKLALLAWKSYGELLPRNSSLSLPSILCQLSASGLRPSTAAVSLTSREH